jgi:putative membrane protein
MLSAAALVATLVVATLHVGFMALETFLWTAPAGRKVFGHKPEDAERTKVLAANQGVYNGALAAMLAWSALAGETHATLASLIFVVAVGLYGAYSVKPTIFFVQALPAAIALALALAA